MVVEIPKRIGYAAGNLQLLAGTLQAIVDEIEAIVVPAAPTPDAVDVLIADAGSRYTAANVEAALAEIAGVDRTNETVKGAADVAGSAAGAASAADIKAQSALDLAGSKYLLPVGGVAEGDLAGSVTDSLTLADSALQPGAPVSITGGTPVNAIAATGVLTIVGVVLDSETVIIGADTYEFAADTAQTVVPGRIAVNIVPHTVKAAGTLTVDTQPIAGDTMTIGVKVYTFVPNGTANADGEVSVGTDLPTAKAAIVAAINGDGHNVAHTLVTAAAFAGNTSVITALIGGAAGDLIATTETFTAGTNIFDAVTLGTTTAGVDCTNVNGGAALVARIVAVGTEPVTAAGTDVVTATADVKGTLANAILTQETMGTGSWAQATLLGGINGTVAAVRTLLADATNLYIAILENTIVDANWRKLALAGL